MNYQAPFYQLLASDLASKLVGHHLARPSFYNERTLVYEISGSPFKRLYISLDSGCPRIYINKEEPRFSSFESPFLAILTKRLHNPFVDEVYALENERIIVFKMRVNDEAYQAKERRLIVELFPRHPNLILVDENGKIISSFKLTNATAERPILRGLMYHSPLDNGFRSTKSYNEEDLKNYYEECEERYESIILERRNAIFGPLIKEKSRRIKQLEKKLELFETSSEEAKKHISDNLIGDAFYMFEEENLKKGQFTFNDEVITFDNSIKVSELAAKYYKRAKKAKKTLEEITVHKAAALRELEEVKEELEQLKEADENLLEEYQPPKGSFNKIKHRPQNSIPLPMMASYKGTTILYGKNSKENDYLSFYLDTVKEHIWLHIKGDSGAHVMIKKMNPTEDEIKVAASIALLASGHEDGEVLYTPHKYVRRGVVSGQAIVSEFKTIYIKRIEESIKKLYASAKRLKR